jgi:hypothetical protein
MGTTTIPLNQSLLLLCAKDQSTGTQIIVQKPLCQQTDGPQQRQTHIIIPPQNF